ncbi:MAG: hypothetical protein ACYDIA_23075 [Candidatus Humimicrobiaceae bacterium]
MRRFSFKHDICIITCHPSPALNHHVTIFGHDGEKKRDTLITDDHVYAVCGTTTAKRQKTHREL